MRKYKIAIRERNVQVEGHRGFTETLPPRLVADWERMCQIWDAAEYPKKVENPFVNVGLCKYSRYLLFRIAYLILVGRFD